MGLILKGATGKMKICIFGGSQPKPGEPVYEEAYLLGKILGTAGHTVLTGGYMGTMEAVSKGANQAGAHVIGVTCDQIEAWRPVKANPWVIEERRCPSLEQRIMTMISSSNAAFALPGGPGTLTEISLMWNLLLTQSIPIKPLILIGPGWLTTFETLYSAQGAYIPDDQRSYIRFAPDARSGFTLLSRLAADPEPG
jgi:hypothetical protein